MTSADRQISPTGQSLKNINRTFIIFFCARPAVDATLFKPIYGAVAQFQA